MSFFPEKSYTYQDIGLVPRDRSSVDSRNRVPTNVQFMGMNLDMPILLAPMETVVNAHVATTVYRDLGGLAILPRLKSLVHTAAMVSSTVEVCGENTVVSIPAKDWEPWADYFLGEMGINKVCIDVANGFTRLVENTVLALKSAFPSVKIITGNIASIEGYKFLANLGVDAVRVGIGSGAVCTTSLATGVGVGQASLVREIAVYKSKLSSGPDIIADGGIKSPGDVCVTGDTLILMKDLTWKKAREVQPGDQIISFDENIQKVKTSGRRYYRTGTVQANTRQDLPCRTILTDKGEVTSSIDHLWLCKTTKGNALAWKKTKDLTVKDKIAYFGEPWTTDNSRQAGYLAGFFDGEGWTCKAISKNKSTYTLGVSQVVGPLGNELKELLKVYGFSNYYIEKSKTNINHQDQEHFHLTGLYNQLSFLGSIRPQRLLKDAEKLWEGQSLKFLQYASIDKIIERNSCETFSVSTTTNTFIANGFMSHNCKAIALGADLVMMGGGFAGCTESPGNLIEVDGKFYKELSGQASMKIKGHSTNVEGATKLVPYKGSINTLWTTYKEGLQSGMSYLDSKSMQEHRLLPDNYFVLLSDAAKKERQVTA